MAYCKVIAVGNLGRDPELRVTPSGNSVTDINIAVTRKWKNGNGELQEETIWMRWTAWGKIAETAATYLKKGQQVMLEGRPQEPRVYQKTDGTWATQLEYTVERMVLLNNGGRGSNAPAPAAEEAAQDFDADFA